MYSKTLYASWADMDFNSHMKNTAFLDKSADVRMLFFSENGFPPEEFSRLRLGPVVLKDEVEYRKEAGSAAASAAQRDEIAAEDERFRRASVQHPVARAMIPRGAACG